MRKRVLKIPAILLIVFLLLPACPPRDDTGLFGLDDTSFMLLLLYLNQPKLCTAPMTPVTPSSGATTLSASSRSQFVGATPTVGGFSSLSAAPSQSYVPDEVLVEFDPGVGVQAAGDRIASRPGILSTDPDHPAVQRLNRGVMGVKLAKGQDLAAAIREMKRIPGVRHAQPNYIYRAAAPDPYYATIQWGLNNAGQTLNGGYGTFIGTPGVDIRAEAAWLLQPNCSGAIVAVLDTGINYNHEDLAGSMWNGNAKHGYDFVDDDSDPMDMNGHGTHIAGIIGATGNNGLGVSGVCQSGVQLMAVRVLDVAGSGRSSDMIQGIDYAIAHNAHIINASWGSSQEDPLLTAAIGRANTANILFVAAAGNAGSNNDTTPVYPANSNVANIISVAAATPTGTLASFSNYGATVDIAAPGLYIGATWPGQHYALIDDFSNGRAGWHFSGSPKPWKIETVTYNTVPYQAMSDPSGINNNYSGSWFTTAYRCFNLTGFDSAYVSFPMYADFENNMDGVSFVNDPSGHVPSSFTSGSALYGFTGSTGGSFWQFDIPVRAISRSYSFGFEMITSPTVNRDGMTLLEFDLNALKLMPDRYEIISGTSMAAPFVSGVAAMLKAKNSLCTAANMKSAIDAGATTQPLLGGKVVSNRFLNAQEALNNLTCP